MWHCLIIEDDEANANYVLAGLRQAGHTATHCRDAPNAMQMAVSGHWDVIILDRMLPDEVDGLSILTAIREAGLATPVIILSALTALDERVRGLQAGSDDYLAKPFAFPELAARIEALIRRSKAQPVPTLLAISDLRVDLLRRRVERAGNTVLLQPREFRLLAYMMANPRQVLTRTMLLEAVWDYRFDPQTNVIDVHISRLRQKIDAGGCTPLIHTVRGVGYILAEDAGSANGAQADPAR
jgi:two-component system, OmpR family, response regulator